ncbi:MAG: MATE family efflux transporter [Phocaeicola sp.]|nr:MATE family efflux transporter [Phocaeicola sp.]
MAVMMWISLFTSRKVLSVLGIEDYGINNVVGGVTSIMWSFIGALSSATTRHITFELGRDDTERLKKIFTTSLSLHALLSLCIIIVCESFGVWFVYNELVLPDERIEAAMWVFHFSILSLVISVMSIPFNACIVAHEKMSAYAYITIVDTLLKLLIVYIINWLPYDNLKTYAMFGVLVQLVVQSIYMIYCSKSFPEVEIRFGKDKTIMKDMGFFALWNLIGSGSALIMQQGHSIILNQFFGPIVNAAKGISGQVLSMIGKFTSNFQIAVNPQIFKSFASSNLEYMHKLIFSSSKYSCYLFIIVAIPVYTEASFLLDLWLEEVPDYTISFLRISLFTAATNILASPLVTSAQATGKIKFFQIIESIILLFILPFSWYILYISNTPIYAFYVYFIFHAIAVLARVLMLRKMIALSSIKYFKKVILPITIVSFISLLSSLEISSILPDTIVFKLFSLGISFSLTVLLIIYIGISVDERILMKEKLYKVLSKIKNRLIK